MDLGLRAWREKPWEQVRALRAREPASFWRKPWNPSSFKQHAVVTETSYQKLEVLSFCDREGSTSFNNNKSDNFSGEKSTIKLSWPGVYFLRIREKTLSEI